MNKDRFTIGSRAGKCWGCKGCTFGWDTQRERHDCGLHAMPVQPKREREYRREDRNA